MSTETTLYDPMLSGATDDAIAEANHWEHAAPHERRGAEMFAPAAAPTGEPAAITRAVAAAAGLDPAVVRATTRAAFLAKYPLPARRPADSALANRRAAALGVRLRPWSAAVAEHVPALVAELGLVATGG